MNVSPLPTQASFGCVVSGLGAADIADGAVRDTMRLPWILNARHCSC